MSTYTQILYQIVFSTFEREETLAPANRQELFRYISGILQNKKCHLYRINGVYDHLHIVTHLHPSISLASLIKDILRYCRKNVTNSVSEENQSVKVFLKLLNLKFDYFIL